MSPEHLATGHSLCERFLPSLDGNLIQLPQSFDRGPTCSEGHPLVRTDLVFKYRTCSILKDWIDGNGSSLNILEIGPGFGALASLIISSGRVSAYTLVDFSSHLTSAKTFLESNSNELNTDLKYLTPRQFARSNATYDLIINEASIAEMSHATAQAYLDQIYLRLRPNGRFWWSNGCTRGNYKGLTQRFQDYRLSRFEIFGVYPQRSRASLLHEGALLLLMGHRGAQSSSLSEEGLEVLMHLAKTGLSEEFGESPLDARSAQMISDLQPLYHVLSTPSAERRIKALRQLLADATDLAPGTKLAGHYLLTLNCIWSGEALSPTDREPLRPIRSPYAQALLQQFGFTADDFDSAPEFDQYLFHRQLTQDEQSILLSRYVSFPWMTR